jgi:L-lactate dehydrogenase complex protein LldE
LKIALFITCFNDTLFPQTGQALVRVLEELGHEVDFPEEQTCCGQMHANTGYQLEAVPLARRFVRVFEPYDVVVTPSGSCAGMVRHEYVKLARLAGDAALAEAAEELAPRVHEFSTFLVDVLGQEDVGAHFPHRVAYHPTCHSLRLLGVGEAPLKLLRSVAEIELVELPAADSCCGFGGTFATKNAAVSGAMLEDKMAAINASGAEVVTAVDNSCLMHIGGGLAKSGSAVRAMHLAEILAAR